MWLQNLVGIFAGQFWVSTGYMTEFREQLG